jgi:hypothetical protein
MFCKMEFLPACGVEQPMQHWSNFSLSNLLQDVCLSDAQDTRTMLDGFPFSTKSSYLHIHAQLEDLEITHIWSSKVLKKIKVFGWLLHLKMVHTRANVLHKRSISSEEHPRCQATVENRTHLFFTCPIFSDMEATRYPTKC